MPHSNLPYHGTESRINSGRNDDDQRFDRYERRWRFRFRWNGDAVWTEVDVPMMDEAESAARAVLEALNQAVQTLLGFFLCFVIVLVIILIFSDSNSHRR